MQKSTFHLEFPTAKLFPGFSDQGVIRSLTRRESVILNINFESLPSIFAELRLQLIFLLYQTHVFPKRSSAQIHASSFLSTALNCREPFFSPISIFFAWKT